MKYSVEEVLQFVAEEDVKFIRLAFCDVYGRQKNISIMPEELPRAFKYGIAFDASAVAGFGDETHSDLFIHPDPETLAFLPWRPEHGKVVRMFSSISYPDGRPFECDTRSLLKRAVEEASKEGFSFYFGAEQEFYLFKLDDDGKVTREPYDEAGYMDIAPDERGENIRREVCLTLEQMGIRPESSHHEEGPGQNEIDFRYSDALAAADNAMTFQTVVKTVASRNGIAADFSAKPLKGKPGNGFHINISVKPDDDITNMRYVMAGILDKVTDITAFLNPTDNSYERFGEDKAPGYVSWSHENRSQLIRVPAAVGEYRRFELRSPDPTANPYLAFALLIYAGLDGIRNKTALPEETNYNLYKADEETLAKFKKLPSGIESARKKAGESEFVKKYVPAKILNIYLND
ncbi:MAG: glutamine synthetase family protein [Lachnospiraceae bacterium]|nr:glutamine synthetase family protein [Lachnospiraceae bacterium]